MVLDIFFHLKFHKFKKKIITYLIFIDFSILKFGFTLFLESDDNKGNEYVNEEEWEHDEINNVEYGHFDAKISDWTSLFVCCCHGILKYSEKNTLIYL